MKLKSLVVAISLFSALAAQAQNDDDVVRYSLLTAGGTARSSGLAGATGALGGDFSALSNNPAGLGLYHGSEFVFTPTIYNIRTTAGYLGEGLSSQTTRFSFNNLGLVTNNKYRFKGKEVEKGWRSVSWAFGFNKIASFANSISYGNYNRSSSIGDKYMQDISGKSILPGNAYNYDPFGSGLAYNAWLLDANYPDSTNYTAVNAGGQVNQQVDINERGAINEMNLGVGANYSEKIFVGASLGIPFVRYSRSMDYVETDDSLKHADFKSFVSSSDLTTTGSGINLKLGLIYKFNDFVRVGAAIHTPTYYGFSDKYTVKMTTVRDTSGEHADETTSSIKYNIYTPWRFVGSAAFMIKQYGFITVDYEFVDHSSSDLTFVNGSASDNAAAHDINRILSKYYTSASNIRIGAEAKIDIFHIRAGYAVYGSPYKTPTVAGYDQKMQVISFGAGLREKDYFFDVTFSHSAASVLNIPYAFENTIPTPAATLKVNKNMLSASIGFKF